MLCIARTMLSQDVRPSVSHTPVYLEMAKRIIKLSSLSGSHTILVFSYQTLWQYYDGNPHITVASNEKNRNS